MDMLSSFGAVGPAQFVLLGFIAFAGSIIGGISSFGAGLIVTPFLMPVVGVKAVVPVMSIAMTLGNLSRVWVYRHQIDRRIVLRIMIPALPCVVMGTLIYSYLPQSELAVLIGGFLLASIPLRRYMARRAVTPTPGAVVGVSGLFGLISGALPGGGVVLMPLLLGLGLVRGAVVGTDALIGTVVNVVKIAMFGRLDLINTELFLAGLLIGLCMVPGAYGARWLIDKMHVKMHTALVEVLVVGSGLSFIWSGLAPA
ncbi:sulfite exporter TauE/SafE family protein [Ancylobacter sp. A5.8]|uniref:sulfite exporter TauE/SafE family protein n=1 Tax=Ancylobacter gelatini TaxID=2919920 RepID=UPI001F4DC694|nr:sulfite exporter TauE/SafE family protein [Ancylobacter gelatini]MCJ8142567.1 sulfite exporter TauE/SafE family protein [Ancylobacter gelatini]